MRQITALQLFLACILMSACSGRIYIVEPDVTSQQLCKNVSCEPGTYCSNGQCLSIVLTGNNCNPLNLKGDCPAGESCILGTCYPSVQLPNACAVGVNGTCADPNLSCNTGNGQCGAVVNACTPNADPSLASSGQCRGSERCVDGYCFFDTALDCTPDQVNGLCASGETCSPAGSCTALPGTGLCGPTLFGGACSAWQSCAEGLCVGPTPPAALACSPNHITGLCPTTEVCVAGECTAFTADNVCNPNHLSGLCAAGAGCLHPGYCEVLTAANTCSPSHLTGGCGYGAACENGTCAQTPCGQPGGYACAAGTRCDVAGGQCVPVLCDTLHPQGMCPDSTLADPLACDNGICKPPTCGVDPNHGVCIAGLVCRSDGVCTLPDCAPTGNQNTSANYCPNPHDVCSADGNCVRRPCSPTVLDGVCSVQAGVTIQDPYRGKVQVPPVCCDPNLASVTGCQQGSCAPPLCANSPNVVQGVCLNSASDYCSNGNCVPAPCTPVYPQGTCTAPEVCNPQAGACTLPDCVGQGANANNYCAPKLCDQDMSHNQTGGTYDTCVSPSCASNPNVGVCNFGKACCNPNLIAAGDPNCTNPNQYGSCIAPACSFTYPGGSCAGDLVCTPTRTCSPGNANDNCCARSPCSDDVTDGNCGPNFACARVGNSNHYTCQIELCSPLAPKGTCNTQGYRCYNANITSGDYGSCQPFVCSDDYPNAPCATGTQCRLSGGHYGCQVPPCGSPPSGEPGGVCADTNQICVAGLCITPACSTTYLAGACPSTQQCCDTALSSARGCELGTCAPKACSGSDPNGYCPTGQICCNPTSASLNGYAGCSGNPNTCQIERCSAAFPASPCPTVTDVCVGGTCQTPCSASARTGWCPSSFACVNGACQTSCAGDYDCDNIANGKDCANPNATNPNQCLSQDTDGDGSPDPLDRDADNDGIPDKVERCPAGHVCNANNVNDAPAKTGTVAPDFVNLDSDGDDIADSLEAGPVLSQPQDTDGDGLPNYRDLDSDNDGILDFCEATDAYGVCTSSNSSHVLIPNGTVTRPVDSDGDGKPDYMDLDSDADGVSDTIEAAGNPNYGVYTSASAQPDYRNLDSDADGIPDKQEDVNGNGIVDCQLDGSGNFVPDTRATPSCSAYNYNPGCNCTQVGNPNGCITPNQKCLFAETSRINKDTNLNTINDPNDGIYQVCGANNLKKINIYYSQPNDYAFALERSFGRINSIISNSANIGTAFDDPNGTPANSNTVNGSYAVSGFILTESPNSLVIGNANLTLVQKALTQAQYDGAKFSSMSGVLTSNLVINRNFTSFDGFGAVVSRYHVTTSSSTTVSVMRGEIINALIAGTNSYSGSVTGLNAETFNDFTVNMETLYRYDDGASVGRVIVIVAVTPTGNDQTAVDTYNYRPSCTGLSSQTTCETQHGCSFATGTCLARQDYQIPLFFADNITSGSAVTQYGSDISSLCQSIIQQNSVLDFIWVVDNSISMAAKIGQVSKASSLFFGLLNNTEADYRVGLTTTSPSIQNQTQYATWEPVFPGCLGLDKNTCETTGSNATAANGGGCSWDGNRNLCQPFCSPFKSSSTCTAAGCTWDPTHSKTGDANYSCYFNGCSSVTNQATCNNVGCSWNSTLSVCRHLSRSDRTNGSLVGDFTGAIAGRYANANDRSFQYQCSEGCAAEDQSGATQGLGVVNQYDQCQPITDPNVCVAYPQCAWSGSACVANCCPICNSGSPPSSVTDAACYFASRLPDDYGNGYEFGLLMGEWAMFRSGAHAGCASASTQTGCQQLPTCVWYAVPNSVGSCIPGYCSAPTTEDQCNGNYPATYTNGDPNFAPVGALNYPPTLATNSNQSNPEPASCEWAEDTSQCVPSVGVPCGAYHDTRSNNPNAIFPLDDCPASRCYVNSAGTACLPNPAGGDVQCSATTAAACYLQAPNWCVWDDCSAYSQSQCGAVYGCIWSGSACAPGIGSGVCHPPLARSIRANATRAAIILSDEEDCYVKDGASGGGHVPAYNGRCEFANYGGGLLEYQDGNRIIRTNAYANAYAARNFLTFAITGDKADPTQAAGTATAWYLDKASCPAPQCVWFSGDPANGNSYTAHGVQSSAICRSASNPNLLCPLANGGCYTQIPNGPLLEAEAGQAYINVAEATGGGWGSICASNLYPTIEATVIASVGKASPYKLNGFVNGHAVQPIASSIQVAVQVCPAGNPNCDGSQSSTQVLAPLPRSRTNGFDYDSTNNTLVLYGSARAFTAGDIVVSYRYWVNTSQPTSGGDPNCPCPDPNTDTWQGGNCACPSGKSCGAKGANPVLPGNNLCNTTANNANELLCNRTAGCVFNSAQGYGCEVTGVCEYDPTCGGRCTTGELCNVNTGLCECDQACGSGCGAGQICDSGSNVNAYCAGKPNQPFCDGDPNRKCHWNADQEKCESATCGSCVCDPNCGVGCAAGQACNGNPASPSCGQCACDTTCGGGCPGHQACDSNPASPTCGFCKAPTCSYVDGTGNTVAGCPSGELCNAANGNCVCDTSCGGSCRQGTTCDANPNDSTCGQCLCDTNCDNVTCGTGQICDSNPAHKNTCGLCVVDPTCGGVSCNPTCSGGTVASCTQNGTSTTCAWKSYKNNNKGACGPIACSTCNTIAGVCAADATCCGGCGPQQICDTTSGSCVCDTTCGGQACQVGYICDGNSADATCGSCICDTTCGGPCPQGDVCVTDPTSLNCGLCVVDPTCGGGCPYPYQCNSRTGLCTPSACGLCPNGYVCSPLTLQCVSSSGG